MKITATLSLTLALLLGAPFTVSAMDMPGMDSPAHAEHAGASGVGVVEAVDTKTGTVTISHEPIKSLGWPAMTMDFVVKDKKILGKLAKGKKVNFTFVQQHGDYVITDAKVVAQ
jgi:Cu(I)/Ag(I) efflux system protein CusF